MPVIKSRGTEVKVDEEGYLLNYEDWNEQVARIMAEKEGLGELTKDKMDILEFIRRFYEEHKFFPIVRAVCKNVHQPKDCLTEKFMDPVTAWKIAGLPNPGEEARIFRDWSQLSPD